MDRVQVQQLGMNIQEETKEKALHALKEANEAKVISDDLQVELLEQRKRIEYIDNMEDEMEGTLKRMGGYIRYFARNFLTNKIILVLIGLIPLSI